jgi:hypothetical protein
MIGLGVLLIHLLPRTCRDDLEKRCMNKMGRVASTLKENIQCEVLQLQRLVWRSVGDDHGWTEHELKISSSRQERLALY